METSGLTPETCETLELLSRSQWNILLIVTGILISLGVTGEQRRRLLCAALGRDTTGGSLFAPRLVSSVIVLCALFFFYRVSAQSARTPADSPRQNDANRLNALAAGLTLAAGLLRLWVLLCLSEPEAAA